MSQRDWVGVTLFGAEKAEDEEDDEEEEEEGKGAGRPGSAGQMFGSLVTELQGLKEPSAKRIKQIERLCGLATTEQVVRALRLKPAGSSSSSTSSSSAAALRDGVRACLRTLETRSKKERDSRRIWLFTNEDQPSEDNDPSQVIKDAQEGGVDVRLWYFAPPGGRPFDETKFYGPLLAGAQEKQAQADWEVADEEETESDTKMLDLGKEDLKTLLDETRSRIFKKRRYARMALRLSESPPVALTVALYKTVQPCTKPAPVQLAATSNRRLAIATKWMCENLVQYVDLDLEAAFGLEVGASGRTVPLERAEFDDAKRAGGGEPGLHLLGFVSASELAWELNVGSSALLYPEELSLKGCTRAFIALREAMLERGRMALVRYHATARTEPRLAVLLATPSSPGLELIKLPFLDDLRAVESPHLDPAGPRADADQVEAARRVVLQLGKAKEVYEAGYANPALQKFYSGLQALALEETEPDWDESRDETRPQEAAQLKQAGKSLRELWEACPEPEKKRKTAATTAKSAPAKKKVKAEGKEKKKKKKAGSDDEDEDMGGGGGGGGEDLQKMTVAELKQLCRDRHLPVSGKKGDLIERLEMDSAIDDF